jgi:hypothetical protein
MDPPDQHDFGLPDPDPLVRGINPDPVPNPDQDHSLFLYRY